MTTSNILNDYNRRQQLEELEEQQDQCFKSRTREHDFESIYSQQISRNIIEVEFICLDCGVLKYVYNYLEDDMLWLVIIIIIVKVKEEKLR